MPKCFEFKTFKPIPIDFCQQVLKMMISTELSNGDRLKKQRPLPPDSRGWSIGGAVAEVRLRSVLVNEDVPEQLVCRWSLFGLHKDPP